MNQTIKVMYDAKSRRLKIHAPFFLADLIRSFPSRRFEPKSKLWSVPLTKTNILHLNYLKTTQTVEVDKATGQVIAEFQDRLAAPMAAIPFPENYDFTKSKSGFSPKQHQRRILDRSWGLECAAWIAKMGTGKTFAAIHLACARFIHKQIDAIVIICPSTLKNTWRKEFEKFATVEYDFKSHETKASWLDSFYNEPSKNLKVMVVSVEGLGVSEALYDSVCGVFINHRVMLIVDESSRIKSPSAIRTKRTIEFRYPSKYRYILNGTPIAVGIQDLWSQYEFLNPEIIGAGDYWAFKSRYVVMGGYEQRQIVGYKNTEELMSALAPWTIEVGKEVLVLPPKVHRPIYIQATPEQKKYLMTIKKGFDEDGGVNIKVDNVLERVLRWKQVVGGWLPKYDLDTETVELIPLNTNPKFDALLSTIEDNVDTSKFIIWSTFVHEIEYIVSQLSKKYGETSVVGYYGTTKKPDRELAEHRYCNDPDMKFFVANPATAGLGLTLISGIEDVMIYYTNTNAFIDRQQSEDRSHRIGQENTVTIIDLVVEKTVDEVVMASNGHKMNIEEYVITCMREGKTLELTG